MAQRTHLVISDTHASPSGDVRIADWVGNLIADLKPEVVVHIGDSADLESLNSFDTGRKQYVGKNYANDIAAHDEFQDRLWGPVKKRKKRQPVKYILEGNHENRIKKAINLQPHLEGAKNGISVADLNFEQYYNEFIEYDGSCPGTVCIDGVHYAHFMVSGVMARPIGGEHHAKSLLNKHHASCTVGHSHLADWAHVKTLNGKHYMGAVVGTLQSPTPEWAGPTSEFWWKGLMIAHNVEDGVYDPEFVSLNRLERAYGEN